MFGSDPAGAWLVTAGVVVGLVTTFALRTRTPARVVVGLLFMSGAAIGGGGMLLQPDPPVAQAVFTVVTLAVLVPFHVRVVVGPFGRSDRR